MVTVQQIEEWSGHRAVDFHYGHIHLMDLNGYTRELAYAIPDFALYLKYQAENTPAFTFIYEGKPILSFGVYPIWPGMGEGWMVPSTRIEGKAVALVRSARAVFDKIGPAMQLRRLQFMVRSSHLHAAKFAEALYFKKEATLSRYGPEGDDYHVYVRFY